MISDERIILNFCIDGWKDLGPLKSEIRSWTIYRLAKKLCGRKLLLHRPDRGGYKTTQRGIQTLEQDKSQIELAPTDTTVRKKELEKSKKIPKKPPVNLPAIQKLLQLSSKKVNFFLSLYPPLQKVPTPTHEATIELFWAEVCDRKWPITHDHHLNFLNFGDIYTWKTSEAEFCAYMTGVEDIDFCIIESSTERGRSLWVRKSGSGGITFKREILEMPLVCLDDYGNADTEAKKAAAHLLRGRIKIPVENEMQMVHCVGIVNLNPKQDDTMFRKTGFDKPIIRRLVPCDLDVIQFPDLKKIGQEALDAAKIFGSLKIKEPTSSCVEYRKKLDNYSEKLFTEEGRKYIDIEGLLNIARGFTGYGFTASEAVRYTLYKVALPYHTVGWLRSEWIEGFSKKKSARAKINKESTPVSVKTGRKDLETLKEEIRFQEEYRDEVNKLERGTIEVKKVEKFLEEEEASWEEFNQFLVKEGYHLFSPKKAKNALEEVKSTYSGIQNGNGGALEELKEANKWLSERYITPFKEVMQQVKTWKEIKSQTWERISNARKISEIVPVRKMIEESSLPSIIKDESREKINKKETDLEKEKKTKTKELKNYLEDMKKLFNYEEMRKQAQDITDDLMNLDLIKRENDHLTGKDGKTYALDAFNFEKCSDTLFFLDWNDVYCRGLSVVTGVKYPTLEERMQNFSFSSSQKGVGNGKMPTWKKWAWGAGITGVAGYSVYSLSKNRKQASSSKQKLQPQVPQDDQPLKKDLPGQPFDNFFDRFFHH